MHLKKLFACMAALLLAIPSLFAQGLPAGWSITPKVSADTGWALVEPFGGCTLTYEGHTLQVLDESLFRISEGATWMDYIGGEGLSVQANGSNLILDVFPAIQQTSFEFYIDLVVEQGAFSIDGVPNDFQIWYQYTVAAGDVVRPEEITSTPPKGTYHEVGTIESITLDWEGFYASWSDVSDGWDGLGNAMKIYVTENGEAYIDGLTPESDYEVINVTVKGQGDAFMGGTRWYPQIVVTPAQTLDNPDKWYTLFIPATTMSFKDYDDVQQYDEYDSSFSLVYTVAGANKPIVSPAQYQSVQGNDFKGLVIRNASSVKVTNASLVKVFEGWGLTTTAIAANEGLLGTGKVADSSTADEIVIEFPGVDFYNGTYTIVVGSGALSGITIGNIEFSVTGKEISADQIVVNTDPANGATVVAPESIKVWWGDYLNLQSVAGTSYDEGFANVGGFLNNEPILFQVMREAQSDDSDEPGGIDGSYDYWLQYNPETPLNGECNVTIPASSLKIYVNGSNQILNNKVDFTFTAEGAATVENSVNLVFEDACQDDIIMYDAATMEDIIPESANYTYTYGDGLSGIIFVSGKGGYDVQISCMEDPSNDTYSINSPGEAYTEVAGGSLTLSLLPGANGYTFNVALVPAYSVQLDFADDCYNDVAITVISEDSETLTVTESPYTLVYDGDGQGFVFTSLKEGYNVQIACTEDPDGANYTLDGIMADETEMAAAQLTLGLYAGAKGYLFNVSLVPAEDESTFPEAKLLAPLNGVSVANMVLVQWGDYTYHVEEGTLSGLITLPNGDTTDLPKGKLAEEFPEDYKGTQPSDFWDNALLFMNINGGNGYSEPGEYTVTIDEGAVLINGQPNPKVELTFTLGSDELAFPEVDPAPGIYEQSLMDVVLDWGEKVALVDAENNLVKVTLNGEDAGEGILTPWNIGGGGFEPLAASEFTNAILIDFSQLDIAWWNEQTGLVQFTLPAGMIMNEAGSTNQEQAFEYNIIMGNGSDEWEPYQFVENPENPWEDLPAEVANTETISVTWNQPISQNLAAEVSVVTATGMETGSIVYFSFDEGLSISGSTLTIDLSLIDTEDVYLFEVPAGMLFVGDNAINNDAGASYKVTVETTPSNTLVVENVDPANGSVIEGGLGNVYIDFDELLDIPVANGERYNLSTDLVKVYVNGELKTNLMGESLYAANLVPTNEQSGGGELNPVGVLTYVAGDASFWWRGEIRIVIAAGAVTGKSGNTNEEIELTYYVYDDADITVTPENGTTFAPGEAVITVSSPDGAVTINPNAGKAPFYQSINEEGDRSAQTPVPASLMTEENGTVVIDFSDFAVGSYSVTFPANAFLVNGDKVSKEAYFDFTVATEVSPELPLASSTPENGYTGTWLDDHATVNWDFNALELVDASKVTFKHNGNAIDVTANLAWVQAPVEGGTPDTGDGDGNGEEGDDNVLVVSWGEWMMGEGTYVLTIPAGTVNVQVDGEWIPNTEVSFSYYVVVAPDVTTIEPTVTLDKEAGTITMNWDGNEIAFTDDFELIITDNVSGDSVVVRAGEGATIDEDGNLVINLGELALDGDYDYTLVLVQGSVEIFEDDVITHNAQVEYSFAYSGVAAIADDGSGLYRVYTLDGVNVLNTANAAELNLLEGGLYIINGKKVLIRK